MRSPGEQRLNRLTLDRHHLLEQARPAGAWYHFKDNRFTTVLNWIPGGILAKISEDGAKDRIQLVKIAGASIFLRLADLAPVVMVNGRVAGTWNCGFTNRSMTVSLFDKLPATVGRQLGRTSKGLTDFLEV